MPLIGPNQLNDCFLYARKKLADLRAEAEKTEEKGFELERLEKQLETLAESLAWVLAFNKKPEEQEVVVDLAQDQKKAGRPKKENS